MALRPAAACSEPDHGEERDPEHDEEDAAEPEHRARLVWLRVAVLGPGRPLLLRLGALEIVSIVDA
jgi:hypothetical protein